MKESRSLVRSRRRLALGLLLAGWLTSSCHTSDLKGGVLAIFAVEEERFAIFVTNHETCDQIIALRDGRSSASIPVGRVRRGSVSYNSPWSWHIDSEDVIMTEAAIEVCDARPSYIEANLEQWIEKVVRFCPWSARLVSVTDYR
jgi:hypothetical protein